MAHIHEVCGGAVWGGVARAGGCGRRHCCHSPCFLPPPRQGNATTSGPVILCLVPVGVGRAATTTTTSLPQLQPPQSGDLSFVGNFTAADIGGPRAGSTLEQLIALFEVRLEHAVQCSWRRPAAQTCIGALPRVELACRLATPTSTCTPPRRPESFAARYSGSETARRHRPVQLGDADMQGGTSQYSIHAQPCLPAVMTKEVQQVK